MTPHWCRRTRRPPRRGATLLELVASMGIVSILLGGVVAAITIAGASMDPDAEAHPETSVTDAARQLTTELSEAIAILEQSSTVVDFTITNRTDPEASPHRIRYEWAGAGRALTRAFDRGAPVEATPALQAVTIGMQTVVHSETTDPGEAAIEATRLASLVAESPTEAGIGRGTEYRLRVTPDLPPQVTAWSLDSVTVSAKSPRTNGPGTLHIGVWDNTDMLLGYVATPISDIDHRAFEEITCEVGESGLVPGESVIVKLWTDPVSAECLLELQQEANHPDAVLSVGMGAAWNITRDCLSFSMIGGVQLTPVPGFTIDRSSATRASVEVTPLAGPSSTTSVGLLNRPELLADYIRADFDVDPTSLDFNADGAPDWACAQKIDGVTLAGGLWSPNRSDPIRLKVQHLVNQTLTVELRARATQPGESGVLLRLRGPDDSAKATPVALALDLADDNTHTLTVCTDDAVKTDSSILFRIEHLPAAFVEARLVFDPDTLRLNLRVNGADRGTVSLAAVSYDDGVAPAELSAPSSAAELDSLVIRVGGTTR